MKNLVLRWGWSFVWLLTLATSPIHGQTAMELREEGVLYLEGNVEDKVTTTVKTTVAVYTHRDFRTALAAFYPGQKVELVGISPDGYLLKGSYRNNTVTGWIRPDELPPGIDPEIIAQAKKNQARHDAVAVAISNKSVIGGMTFDEVKAALGKPEQISSHEDANGMTTTWTYVTYRQDPQYNYALDPYGRVVLQTYYVKVPIGQKIIDFANGGVVGVTEHKTDPSSPGVVVN